MSRQVCDFVSAIGRILREETDEQPITERIAGELRVRLECGLELSPEVAAPCEDHYVMRPLYVDPQGRFSIACAVWNVEQKTPVHGHETWESSEFTRGSNMRRPMSNLRQKEFR